MALTNEASADEVCVWLKSFKTDFSKYFATIRENEVTGAMVLAAPLDDLLAMMGVVSVGHRHLLRKEITATREQTLCDGESGEPPQDYPQEFEVESQITADSNAQKAFPPCAIGENSSSEDVSNWLLSLHDLLTPYAKKAVEMGVDGNALFYAPLDDLMEILGVEEEEHRQFLFEEFTILRQHEEEPLEPEQSEDLKPHIQTTIIESPQRTTPSIPQALEPPKNPANFSRSESNKSDGYIPLSVKPSRQQSANSTESIAPASHDFLSDPGIISRLDSPFETHDWAVLRSGFLRRIRHTLGRARITIYLFLLKQHPVTKSAALECYMGLKCQGMLSLRNARIVPHPNSIFVVSTPSKEWKLQVDVKDTQLASSWVLDLQQVSITYDNAMTRGNRQDKPGLEEHKKSSKTSITSETQRTSSPNLAEPIELPPIQPAKQHPPLSVNDANKAPQPKQHPAPFAVNEASKVLGYDQRMYDDPEVWV